MENIKNVDEFKLKIYTQYATPSMRYMLTVHELTDTQLEKLDHFHTNAIKRLLGLPSKGPTPVVIHSPDGLGIPRVSDTYLELHTLAYAQCMGKADNRVVHALKCKVDRESEWRRKKIKHDSSRAVGTKNINKWLTKLEVLGLIGQNSKQMVKDLITTDRAMFWGNYIKSLVQQGNLLKLIDSENADLTWKSIIYDLPRRVLSFAVRASIDFLPTFSKLKTWGKRLQTKCKFCGNQETLVHILNSWSVFLNQGRFTRHHDSILVHILKQLKKRHRY